MGRFWAASPWSGRDAQKLWRSSASKILRRSEVPTSLAGGRGNTEAVGQVGLRPSIISIAMLNFVRVFGILWIVLVFRGVYLAIEYMYEALGPSITSIAILVPFDLLEHVMDQLLQSQCSIWSSQW